MDFLILILFIVEIVILAFLDRILFGTFITPITIISVPYLFIVLLALLIGPDLGFFPFYFPSLWIWIIGLPFFWIPGFFLSTFLLGRTNNINYPYRVNQNQKLDDMVFKISYFIIIFLFYGFIKSIGKYRIGTEEFGNVFGTGLSGHIMLLSKLFYVYLIIVYRKKYLIPILVLTAFYLSYGSKTWVLVPFFSAIIARILLKKINIKFSLLLKMVFFGMLVFYLVYRISLGTYADFTYIYFHFFKYVFAGVLGLSQYSLSSKPVGIDPTLLINPLVNIFNIITNSELQSLPSNIYTNIGLHFSPNVKTFFGTIYLYGGIGWGMFFSMVFGAFSYLFLVIVIRTKELIYLVVYALIITSLLYGWFDIYLNNLFFYELPVFSVIFVILYPSLTKVRLGITKSQKRS